MKKWDEDKRKDYMDEIRRFYGVDIKEHRQRGQKCGYFHIIFPIFADDQEPGSEPVGFNEPVTEYTESRMKFVVNHILFTNDWYMNMCKEWKKKETVVMDPQESVIYEEQKAWEEQ